VFVFAGELREAGFDPAVRDQLTADGKWRSRGLAAVFALVVALALAFLFFNARRLEALGNRAKFYGRAIRRLRGI
jgi:hypothetical protein